MKNWDLALENATWMNTIGDPELLTVWTTLQERAYTSPILYTPWAVHGADRARADNTFDPLVSPYVF